MESEAKKGTPIPDHVEKVRELKSEEKPVQEFTPESVQEDESLMEIINLTFYTKSSN